MRNANRLFVFLLGMSLLWGCCGAANAATPMAAAGNTHTVALHADGTLRAWGDDTYGQLGLSRLIQSATPIATVGLTGVTAIAAGNTHTVALKTDGSVWAWGKNDAGQLGDGSRLNRATPAAVPGLTGAIAIAAGGGWGGNTFALKADGSVWAWGAWKSDTPAVVSGISEVIAIAAGELHTVALKKDGSVWAWGDNQYGQLGDGSNTNRAIPTAVQGLSGIIAITAGAWHTLALKSDGSVWAWGNNEFGELGDGMTTSRASPVRVQGLTGVVAVATGELRSFALKADGSVWTWGATSCGGYTCGRTIPAVVSGLSGVIAIAAGSNHTVVLKADGSVWAWGGNQYGELGDGSTTNRYTPAAVPGLSGVIAIAAGGSILDGHTVVLKADGKVWAFGSNLYGELGDGSTTNHSTPATVPGISGVIAIAANGSSFDGYTVALKSDGSVWTWGSTTNRSTPAAVPGLTEVIAIAAGSGIVALRSDGSVWTGITNPTAVPGLTGVIAIAAGHGGIVALRADGSVWTSLGSGITNPTAVPGLTGVIAIAAGSAHTVALKSDGSVWAWGNNTGGQLGDGSNKNRATPAAVPGLSGVIAIAAGGFTIPGHTVALKSDGSVWAWGTNGHDQPRVTPAAVLGLTGVIAIAAGDDHTVTIKADGSVAAWGDNSSAQLGDGTFAQPHSPVLVVNPSVDGFLNLNTDSVIIPPPELQVPFFVSSTGGITDTSATVITTIKFNAADVGKQNSVFITAMVPAKYFGLASHVRAASVTKAAADPNACVAVNVTPSGGLQQQINSELIPWLNNVTGDQASDVKLLDGITAGLDGSNICVGYGSNSTNIKMRSVVTIPGTNPCPNICPGTTISVVTAYVLEFYNTNLDHYFITADTSEATAIDSGSAGPGWSRTGNSFKSGGDTSVCRFYGSQSPGPNSHFYTVDASECAGLQLLQAGTPDTEKRWNFESLDFVSTPPVNGACPAGATPVYRAYNNGFSRGVDSNHRITSSATAIQEVVTRGWSNEGVVMCAPN